MTVIEQGGLHSSPTSGFMQFDQRASVILPNLFDQIIDNEQTSFNIVLVCSGFPNVE